MKDCRSSVYASAVEATAANCINTTVNLTICLKAKGFPRNAIGKELPFCVMTGEI
jgi:hypothetical protein